MWERPVPNDIVKRWLNHLWRKDESYSTEVLNAYRVTFTNPHGQVVLKHLMDTVYCEVAMSSDPHEAIAMNARRSVVHEMLVWIDMATNPSKYAVSDSDANAQRREVRDGSLV